MTNSVPIYTAESLRNREEISSWGALWRNPSNDHIRSIHTQKNEKLPYAKIQNNYGQKLMNNWWGKCNGEIFQIQWGKFDGEKVEWGNFPKSMGKKLNVEILAYWEGCVLNIQAWSGAPGWSADLTSSCWIRWSIPTHLFSVLSACSGLTLCATLSSFLHTISNREK